jgi:HPt (histidine-containing phosphotransfer) domain-containing protein
VPPLPPNGTHAKRPGEINRPLRVSRTPAAVLIHWENLAVQEHVLGPEFGGFLQLYLVDTDLHMLEIARCRARKDFGAVARQAGAIADAAEKLGAPRTADAARNLETACRAGDHAATYDLIGELNQACGEAANALREWLCRPGQALAG